MPKTSQYGPMTDLTGSEKLLGVQSNATETVTLDQVAAYAAVAAGAVTLPAVQAMLTPKANTADLAAETGAGLVGFKQSGVTAVARTMQDKARDVISLLDFIPAAEIPAIRNNTSTYDCTSAIVNWLGAIGEHSHGIAPHGTYISDTVVIDNMDRRAIEFRGILKRKAGTLGGVQIKGCQNARIFVHHIDGGVYSEPADYDLLTGTALEILANSNCDIEIGRAAGFQHGIKVRDHNGTGNYFNRIKWAGVQYVKYGLELSVADGVVGFVNGNKFHGGDLRASSAAVRTVKGSAQVDPFNGNQFFGVDVEKAANAYDLNFFHYNQVIARIEGGPGAITGRWLKTSATCQGNTYIFNMFPLDKLEVNGKAERLMGTVMDTDTGVAYGAHASTDHAGGTIHVWCFRDTSSVALTSNGVSVKNYIFNSDTGSVSAVDKGITALKIRDTSGIKRVIYKQDGTIDAINADADLPYGITVVRVQTNTAAVKLKLKTSDYQPGRMFFVDVGNFTNALTIRNETDTSDVVASGVISSSGMWMVYISSGFSTRVTKLS